MRVLVVGGGGREHALCWKIKQSPLVDKVYSAPGNAGIGLDVECVDISATDIEALLRFAKASEIGLTVVGPEAPLALGIVDRFKENNLTIFGPTARAAELESSKAFSKNIMKKYDIPTAFYSVFDNYDDAMDWVREVKPPLVIKADGLAAGKGVVICETEAEAHHALDDMMSKKIFGDAGDTVVVEEFLRGEEASFFAITDGTNILPLEPSQDHKALLDNDQGPNTGGMGAYTPAPVVTDDIRAKIIDEVIVPIVEAMNSEGREYKGVIYAGLMIEDSSIKVLEFNCRFGDPEAQPLIMRMKSDIVPMLLASAEGNLTGQTVEWHPDASVCVVMASKGYPGDYKKGKVIEGLENIKNMSNVKVFHSGTALNNGDVVTNGGRVLGVTSLGSSIPEAIDNAYSAVGRLSSDFLCYRTDIGKKALKYL